jgi:S1-C subfamily serine protease
MRMPKRIFLVLLACAVANVAHAQDRTQIIARAKLSIAKITVELGDGRGGVGTGFLFTTVTYPAIPRTPGKFGSGRAAVERGELLTNCHVVKGALKVEVQFMNVPDGLLDPTNMLVLPWEGKVLGCDDFSDLAVVEFGPDAANQALFHLPPVLPFAHPADIHAGDEVMALGFGLNLGGDPSVSRGIISAVNRGFPSETDCEDEQGKPIPDCAPGMRSGLIQTDASINHGNSGGPLLNMRGEVVGVNTYGSITKMANSVFYARSVETAAPFAKMLLANGRVIRADLGLGMARSVPADYHQVALKHGGARILSFTPNSPGQRAGLRVGDIILSVQRVDTSSNFGQPLPFEVRDIGSLLNLLAYIPSGAIVTIEVFTPNYPCPDGKPTWNNLCIEKDLGHKVTFKTE